MRFSDKNTLRQTEAINIILKGKKNAWDCQSCPWSDTVEEKKLL